MIPSLELRNVTKKFAEVTAVDDVNFQVQKGELFSLLGPSGCGKTTTLRLCGGLEKPDQGAVLIKGELVNDVPPYRRNTSIVFQKLALFPHLTLEENVSFGLERRKLSRQEIKDRVGRIIALVKLSGMERRRPDQLSGGQQQRVALARSLVLRPEVLFLDEPLASLDRKLRKEMQIELKRIQKETDTTFVYVTHDQKVALAMSDRVAVMKQGQILQIGTADEIYEKPKSRFVADFMGFANVFCGETTDRSEDRIKIITEEGLELQAFLEENLSDDQPRWICIRPESIEVVPKDFPLERDNMFVGKIRDIAYQGDFTEIEILLEGGHFLVAHVYRQSEISRSVQRLSKNDEVLAGWSKEQCVLVSE